MLTEHAARVIAETLTDIWKANCAERSAKALEALGIDAAKLHEFRQTSYGRALCDDWYLGTLGELRDREIRKNKTRKKKAGVKC